MIEFRNADAKDVPVLIQMRTSMLQEEGEHKGVNIEAEMMEFYTRRLRNDTMVMYVAEEKEEILGICGCVIYDMPPTFENRTGLTGYVNNLFVHPESRERQIGQHLLSLVLKECKARGLSTVWAKDQNLTRDIYMAFGFQASTSTVGLNLKKWKAPEYGPIIHAEDMEQPAGSS